MVSAFSPLFLVVLVKVREAAFRFHPILNLFSCLLVVFFHSEDLYGVQRGNFVRFMAQVVIQCFLLGNVPFYEGYYVLSAFESAEECF